MKHVMKQPVGNVQNLIGLQLKGSVTQSLNKFDTSLDIEAVLPTSVP